MGEGDVGQVSPDGKWYWNGTNWLSSVSSDGKSRWNGASWVPNQTSPRVTAQSPWTKGLFLGGGIFGALLVVAVVIGSVASAFGSPRSADTLAPVVAVSSRPQVSPTSQSSSTPSASTSGAPSSSPSTRPSPKPSPKASP